MSESETNDTLQIGSDASNDRDEQNRGYTLATGAPRPPTKTEKMRSLMYMEPEEACRVANEWGIKEHRGGDASAPFAGDKVAEVHKEGIDLQNYAKELVDDGYSYEICERMNELGVEVMMMARLLAQNGGE